MTRLSILKKPAGAQRTIQVALDAQHAADGQCAPQGDNPRRE